MVSFETKDNDGCFYVLATLEVKHLPRRGDYVELRNIVPRSWEEANPEATIDEREANAPHEDVVFMVDGVMHAIDVEGVPVERAARVVLVLAPEERRWEGANAAD